MTDKQLLRRAFATALRKRRVRKKLSQEQLSHEGVARSHVSDLERGLADPRLSTLFQLTRILGMRPTIFMRDIERQYAKMTKGAKDC